MREQWFFLDNTPKHYHWGSVDAIRNIMKLPADDKQPLAELWMGAHESSPSMIRKGSAVEPLSDTIRLNPDFCLGPRCRARFGDTLPYLFKVLSAAHPLSVQVHPDLARAKAGYERENREHIALDAAHRNYRDTNHKPEIIAALTRFSALCGFRPIEETTRLFRKTGIRELLPAISALESSSDYRIMLKHLWTLEAKTISAILGQLSSALSGTPQISVNDAEKHPFAAMRYLEAEYPGDIGILSPLYLNTITLEPGEGLFLPAGILHSYLSGTGLELMANSDNVLRGGLTSKHIDIPEVLDTIIPQPHIPDRLIPIRSGYRSVYKTSADEFELSVIDPEDDSTEVQVTTPSILVVIRGTLEISGTTEKSDTLPQGSSLFLPAAAGRITLSGKGTAYLASVPEISA